MFDLESPISFNMDKKKDREFVKIILKIINNK